MAEVARSDDGSDARSAYQRNNDRMDSSPLRSLMRDSNTMCATTTTATSSATTTTSSTGPASIPIASISTKRLYYRAAGDKSVTRDIAALDFLLGIPLEAEETIVRGGWMQQREAEKDFNELSTRVFLSNDISSRSFRLEVPSPDSSRHVDGNQQHKQATKTQTPTTAWWRKYVRSDSNPVPSTLEQASTDFAVLERPTVMLPLDMDPAEETTGNDSLFDDMNMNTQHRKMMAAYTPGRRLDGDKAVRLQVPRNDPVAGTRQKTIAHAASVRAWERQTAHGTQHAPLLEGRLFFSATGSYPVSVFSVIRYEPRREHAEFLRKKLESLGGGGSRFVMPTRDWRGISYRVLLPRNKVEDDITFNRFVLSPGNTPVASGLDELRNAETTGNVSVDTDTNSILTDDDMDEDYVPGILDDPNMRLGRHRNIMIGDHISGPIIASTIQFAKPALLKADLNRQFRERFDGWEPPKAARKFIGAYVSLQEGKYVLHDPTEEVGTTSSITGPDETPTTQGRKRRPSVSSIESASDTAQQKPALRIPPSLTLSKIRSLKRQALAAGVRANLEIGSIALACVYFERLCLDCRVDKSNRRLTFAACLLIAAKLNEPTVGLVVKPTSSHCNPDMPQRLQVLIRPNQRSDKMFASLLEFFTETWSLSVKNLLDAEWGVFAALGFSLHATPSQVAFHFKRLMKTLEWNALEYLGPLMWERWQEALLQEDISLRERERRLDYKRKLKEERLLNLQLELENEVLRRQQLSDGDLEDAEVSLEHPPRLTVDIPDG